MPSNHWKEKKKEIVDYIEEEMWLKKLGDIIKKTYVT